MHGSAPTHSDCCVCMRVLWAGVGWGCNCGTGGARLVLLRHGALCTCLGGCRAALPPAVEASCRRVLRWCACPREQCDVQSPFNNPSVDRAQKCTAKCPGPVPPFFRWDFIIGRAGEAVDVRASKGIFAGAGHWRLCLVSGKGDGGVAWDVRVCVRQGVQGLRSGPMDAPFDFVLVQALVGGLQDFCVQPPLPPMEATSNEQCSRSGSPRLLSGGTLFEMRAAEVRTSVFLPCPGTCATGGLPGLW